MQDSALRTGFRLSLGCTLPPMNLSASILLCDRPLRGNNVHGKEHASFTAVLLLLWFNFLTSSLIKFHSVIKKIPIVLFQISVLKKNARNTTSFQVISLKQNTFFFAFILFDFTILGPFLKALFRLVLKESD